MRSISFAFFALLVFQVISIEFREGILDYYEDFKKCNYARDVLYDRSQLTASKCKAVNPLLESKGKFKGECCKIISFQDPLIDFKKFFAEDWKKMAIEKYQLDENISEEELREVAISQSEKDGPAIECGIILENTREVNLYEFALTTVNNTFKYDCGSGEKIFNARDFVPKNEEDIIGKDLADCLNFGVNYNEKKCLKQGNKLLSDNTQCCWCVYKEGGEMLSNICFGSRIDEMKESFNALKSTMNTQMPGRNLKINCRCANKRNEMVNANFDTISDDMIIN
jgi:hypothetical protein